MTSRTLISGTITVALVRRRRNADGGLFGFAYITDRDRLETRKWKVFANDVEIIERLEALRIGEPIALSGPFSIITKEGVEVEFRVTAEQLIDAKKPKKSKAAKAQEERVKSDEWSEAPKSPVDEGRPFNDDIGF